MNLLRWYECMRRREHHLTLIRNVYGDEILLLNARSIWKCSHCARLVYRPYLAEAAANTEGMQE
jgi:hypothetical protein